MKYKQSADFLFKLSRLHTRSQYSTHWECNGFVGEDGLFKYFSNENSTEHFVFVKNNEELEQVLNFLETLRGELS